MLAASLVAAGCADVRQPPRAVDGRLDLSRWDFSAGSVTLLGTWAVCWGQLLEPGEACPHAWKPVGVRGLWSDDSARSPFGGRGVATYRLRLELPEGEQRLSLRAGAPMTAYRLWIDGEERGGVGVVGRSAATTSPDPRRNHVFELPRGASEIHLWVQLANFEFRGGGIRRDWVVGRPEAIQSRIGLGLLRDVLLFAVSLVVGLAYLLQFALRPRESTQGYFGLFALVIAMRVIAASVTDFAQLLVPWASFAQLLRVEYLSTALSIFAGAGYFRVKVPGVMPPRTLRGLQLVALALAPVEVLAPVPLVLQTLPVFMVLGPLLMGLVFVCHARAWWRGVPGVGVTLAGSLVFLASIVHDVIRAAVTDFGTTFELFPYSLVVWLVVEAIELAQSFNRAFERVESLSDELADANFELQETESAVARFVPFDFLNLLGKRSIREVAAGDHTRSRMSVLHCEIQGFGPTLERMSSEQAFRFIYELMRELEPSIYHNGGFVSQYRGDGLQALFPGGPDPAVAAALQMFEGLRAFNREGSDRGRPSADLGIGIDTGPLLLGTIGEEQHLASGVIGEPVTTAPRIAALTRSSEARLVISEATRDGLDDASSCALQELPPLEAVPGARTLVAYEVLDARDGKPTSAD